MAHIETEQSRDLPLTEIVRGPFTLRFASYRKGEDAKLNLRSEDFIVSDLTPEKAIFSLCDGVGSSFYGNIGSQILGVTLTAWLGKITPPNHSILNRAESTQKWLETLTKDLLAELNAKTRLATSIIRQKDLSNKEELIRLAEETQRDDFGTQSNFACGVIWPRSPALPNGLVILFWLGNARLRLFHQKKDLTHLLGWGKDPDQLRDVWSSKDGVVGTVRSHITDLSNLTTVIAYSDGLENAEDQVTPELNPNQIAALTIRSQGVKDDDVTFLELSSVPFDVPGSNDDIVGMLRGVQLSAPVSADTSDETAKLKHTVETLRNQQENLKTNAGKSQRNMIAIATFIAMLCFVIGFFTGAILKPLRGFFKPTITPTASATLTLTLTPSQTPSPLPTMTDTPSPTDTATETETATSTFTPLPTDASASPETGSITPTLTYTATVSATGSPKP